MRRTLHFAVGLFWIFIWLLTLCIANIDVRCADGFTIKLIGWFGGRRPSVN